MGASMQMDSPMMVAVADVAPQDVSMADNGSKTFLFLRLQGSATIKRVFLKKKYERNVH